MGLPLDSGTEPDLAPLLAHYRPRAGIFDELLDEHKQVRPHWRPLLSLIASLGTEEANRRFTAADRYLRDSGVFYRVYEDQAAVERPWPLSHIPLVLDPTEWQSLEEGLCQRAGLLEEMLDDCYGDTTLVRDGRLPAIAIAGSREFLRPVVGIEPRGGTRLRLYAVDVGRGTDGKWWVLGDRTQAPSGMGFALENRLAMTRALPELHRTLRVERLASFFQMIQNELAGLSSNEESRVCLLTPGPMNETYYEHAYLARYLGFLLVEGADLLVRDEGVFVRTVSGLKRTEVLLRRLDADFADPLELNPRSQLGVPGLVQAARAGRVTIANALGSGLLEARVMLSFLPAIAEALTGTGLTIPNVATWWLGQKHVRERMIGKLESLVVAPAFSGHLPGYHASDEMLGASLPTARRMALRRGIERRGIDYVVQEAVSLSTMPVWKNGHLVPRPFVLRLFLAKVGTGWKVMPGGFARVADDIGATSVALQQGGRTADVWVAAAHAVQPVTLLPRPGHVPVKRAVGALPSRAADNLFWVARYIERAEGTLRLVRVLLARIAEGDEEAQPIIRQAIGLLAVWNAAPILPTAKPVLIAAAALQRRDLSGALPALVTFAHNAASVVRDRLSPDSWHALTDLATAVGAPMPAVPRESELIDRVNVALRIILSFYGLAQENMSQLAGWRFFEIGRRIERAIAVCRWLRIFGAGNASAGALDAMLELCDSQITYRQRYVMVAARAPVVDLVALDPNNPRSIIFQIDRIETHLAVLPRSVQDRRLTPSQQIATSIATSLRTAETANLDDGSLATIESSLMSLSESITAAYFTLSERRDDPWEALS